MKICPSCNCPNPNDATYCVGCGADVAAVTIQPDPAPVMQPTPAPPVTPAPIPIYQAKPKEPISWYDVCGMIGFIASILGVFWCSIVLMPIGILLSLLGFLGTRFRGMSIAGLTISLLGALIKLCLVLYDSGIAPDWVTKGILF